MVEDVAANGAAAQGGVLAGDILHALTVVMDRSNLGIKTEDFVSSVVGGLGRWRQTIMDASYINTVDELVSQFKSNTMLGSETELLLIFERDISTSPKPAETLEPDMEEARWALKDLELNRQLLQRLEASQKE
eukprot:symbB.v1.2.033651.t3/scaffold4211.1/size43043/1